MKEEAGSKRLILFRCDGVANTGLGHVSRSLAIAEGFDELGVGCHFIGRFEPGAVEMLTTAGRSFSGGIEQTNSPGDIQRTVAKARELSASGVFVDSYAVDDDYIAALHRQAAPVLLIDDYGRLERYECAALMCFLVGAADQGYPVDRIPCFLGPGYFPARKELRQLRREGKEFREKAGRALIAIGGVDLQDLTGRAARILLEIAPELSVHAVVGRHYERVGELSEMVGRFGGGGEVFAFGKYTDGLAVGMPLVAGFVRIGNFFNSEIVGREVGAGFGSNFGVVFAQNGEAIARHPVQIYEGLLLWAIFALLLWLWVKKRARGGVIVFLFIGLYFLGRFGLEFFKEYQVLEAGGGWAMGLTMGQVLSVVPVLLAVGYFAFVYPKQFRS